MARTSNEMAYVAEITYIKPIDGADAIECVIVNGGWPVVTKKGEYKVGDVCVYFELDAWIPTELAPFLSRGNEPRVYDEVAGERLRSVKLRGQKSQGLVLPLDVVYTKGVLFDDVKIGFQVGDLLGVQKWERPDSFGAGQAKGNFPSYLQKTDQNRIQNIARDVFGGGGAMLDTWFEIDMKLDGSSTQTLVRSDGEFVVCSRNLQLKVEDGGSSFVNTVKRVFGENGELIQNHKDLSFQMELIGPGVQKNREELSQLDLYVFDIYNTITGTHLSPDQRHFICKQLGLNEAPVIASGTLRELGLDTLEKVLAFAEGKSLVNKVREGVVFKSKDGQFSFKAISDAYLLAEK